MKSLFLKLRESLLDDEDELLDRMDDDISGFTNAIKYIKRNSKKINRSLMSNIIYNIIYFILHENYPKKKSLYSELECEELFINSVLNTLKHKDIDKDFIRWIHKVFYKYGNDIFEFIKNNDWLDVSPKYHEKIEKIDIDNLKRYKFKEYKNAQEWVVWSQPYSPGTRFMLKTIKGMEDKHEEFLSLLMKNITD